MPSLISKYLSQYAEPEAHTLSSCVSHLAADCAVVIPLKDEVETIGPLFDSLTVSAASQKRHLLSIVIVNGPPSASNTATLNRLTQKAQRLAPGFWFTAAPPHSLLAIDATSEDPKRLKAGVGLARKMGCDIAVRLHEEGIVKSNLVRTTDADARVDSHYLSLLDPNGQTFVYAYQHGPDPAHQLYETYLRYYTEGLRKAHSPYAFHTIGSTIAVRASAYAAVRGFPKREAAEDFYILNKLAKVGRVNEVHKSTVTLYPRLSDRVPFGTGVGTASIRKTLSEGKPFTLYDPKTFLLLAQWIKAAESYCDTCEETALVEATRDFEKVIGAVGGYEALRRISKASPKLAVRRKAFHDWFDAFRTLRFVHLVESLLYPKLFYKTALADFDAVTFPTPALKTRLAPN